MSRQYFASTFNITNKDMNIVEHIRWCRNNLGERGRDWDFSGNDRRVQIWVREGSKQYSFYELKYGSLRQR